MQKLGKEQDSKLYWEKRTEDYCIDINGQYHQHRLNVIKSLIPKELYAPEKNIFDFGCGDAVYFSDFLKAKANITGIDITQEMIDLAKKRLSSEGYEPNIVQKNDVNFLKTIESSSLDAVLSFNVLAYLSDEEEEFFYNEVMRILKSDGYLIVTHSNELFDLFSLNKYTVEFFKKYLTEENINDLLVKNNQPENIVAFNVRENPLSYKYKLQKYNLKEIKQEFINLHKAPPVLLTNKDYPDTLNIKESEKWKLMFTCSTYGSLSKLDL